MTLEGVAAKLDSSSREERAGWVGCTTLEQFDVPATYVYAHLYYWEEDDSVSGGHSPYAYCWNSWFPGWTIEARITQIMNLLNLAPDIQEALLFLPLTLGGRDPIGERDVRPVAQVPHWKRQRTMWAELTAREGK